MNQEAILTSAYESIGQAFKQFFERFFDAVERIKNIFARYEKVYKRTERENREAMWLWRKCGGYFYGAKTTVCTASSYYNTSSKIGVGRMRESSSGTGTAAVGAEETEHEER